MESANTLPDQLTTSHRLMPPIMSQVLERANANEYGLAAGVWAKGA